MITQVAVIAAGGAVGALLRFWMAQAVYFLLGRDFPYGTLAVNVLGSFLIGCLFVLMLERSMVSEIWRAGILIGLIGSFTTFSTFSLETINLIEDGLYLKAIYNIASSVILCLGGTFLGILLARSY
ncbi:fluoride efflux transporter CrcB [Pseudomonadota bacterium]